MSIISLTPTELDKIKATKKALGSGVDGTVYAMDNKTVYKFYHDTSDTVCLIGPGIYDDEGVNIKPWQELMTDNRAVRENKKPINYIDKEGVILSKKAAITKAVEKQKYVKLTKLPQAPIMVDHRLVGCAYHRYHTIWGIYALGLYPPSVRKKVMRKLYVKLRELYANNIYPVTLAQKDKIHPFSRQGSNVLLGFGLEPQIIDLDGISAFYSDTFCKAANEAYKTSLSSFSLLALEVISGLDIMDEDIDVEYFVEELKDKGIDPTLAKEIVDEYGFKDEERIIKLLK